MAEILDTVKEISAAALKKADQACRVTRLRLSRCALKNLLERQYMELGKTVYSTGKSGRGEDREEIASMTVQIDGTRKRIAALDRRIADVLELINCPKCGNVLKIKNAYCPRCGKKLAAEEEGVCENENEMVAIAEIPDDDAEDSVIYDLPDRSDIEEEEEEEEEEE